MNSILLVKGEAGSLYKRTVGLGDLNGQVYELLQLLINGKDSEECLYRLNWDSSKLLYKHKYEMEIQREVYNDVFVPKRVLTILKDIEMLDLDLLEKYLKYIEKDFLLKRDNTYQIISMRWIDKGLDPEIFIFNVRLKKRWHWCLTGHISMIGEIIIAK